MSNSNSSIGFDFLKGFTRSLMRCTVGLNERRGNVSEM